MKVPKMNHIVITGPPGSGKTTLAEKISLLFNRMGMIRSDKIVRGNRTNMIGSYLGTTAKLTQQTIDKAIGGVLLIDEAYNLGSSGSASGDSYAQECVNTLNQNLTEKGDQFQCIIIGYRDALESQFFALNSGLKRRFQWHFDLPGSTSEQLSLIFKKMAQDEKLTLSPGVGDTAWFASRMTSFEHSGGSCENLVQKVKVAYCRRVFGQMEKGSVLPQDLETGYKLYKAFEHSQVQVTSKPPEHMYM